MMFHYSVNVVLCGVIFITFVSIIWADCKRKSAIYDLMTGTITLEDYSLITTVHGSTKPLLQMCGMQIKRR